MWKIEKLFASIQFHSQVSTHEEDAFYHVILPSKRNVKALFSSKIRKIYILFDIFSKTVLKYEGVVFLQEEINFQQVFKLSKDSEYYNIIKNMVRRYFEAGILDRIINDIHQNSHKYICGKCLKSTFRLNCLFHLYEYISGIRRKHVSAMK